MANKKIEGQYMTPDGIVSMILNTIGYKGLHVLNKTIMEPSFGDGAFLINIIQRIITEGKKSGLTECQIGEIINDKVFGIEKDKNLYNQALQRLNSLLAVYGIKNVIWNNLICGDTLIVYKRFKGNIDYVVGNPPYVRIHNIPDEYRDVVKDFRFVDGMIDLYIVFYEIGILMLNDTGKLGYISPNSFMKNTSQRKFRNYLVENKYISAIYDFKTSKIFEDADTYTCICILNKNSNRVDFSVDYKEFSMYQMVVENRFEYDYFRNQLQDAAWNLSSDDDIKFLEKNKGLPIKVHNMAIVQNGIATNKDAAYVVHAYIDKELVTHYIGKHSDRKKIVYFCDKNGFIRSIESSILHRCVKASRYDGKMDNNNTYIIFPYEKNPNRKFFTRDGKEVVSGYQPLTESKLKRFFPKAYEYLSSLWDELITRDMDKNVAWFLFGRNQGLQNSCYKKVVFKHIINKSKPVIVPYILDEDVIVYSGMYTTVDINLVISPKMKSNGEKEIDKYIFDEALYEYALKDVYNIFISDDFAKYCSMIGKDMSGGYVGISTKMVKQFGTMLNTFPNFPVVIPREDLEIADNNYMNQLFQTEFIKCIKIAYENMGESGKTSNRRVEPFHSFLAKVLQYKLGTDYDVFAAGYSYSKECTLGGNFDNKNVDICVKKNGKEIGAIAFKLLSNNFKQNNKNFIESMLGEAVQMRDLGLPYAFCYLIPEKALYLTKTSSFVRIDKFTQDDLKVYYDICTDPKYNARTPDVLFVGVHKLFEDSYLDGLVRDTQIDINSSTYLNSIRPMWSDYLFVSDEDMREYFLENNNIGVFLDKFISSIFLFLRKKKRIFA